MTESETFSTEKCMLDASVQDSFPIFLPWCKASLFIGNGFDSNLARNNQFPWKGRTPFKDIHLTPLESERSKGPASFRESTSDNSKTDSSHLSASLGVTVGCDYLSANVTGSYDQVILKSSHGSRTSKHTSYTAGHVSFAETPSLDIEALGLVASNPEAFRNSFGDYFVAGLQLGANAGMSLICKESSNVQTETRKVSVTAHFILWSATTELVEHNDEREYDIDLSFCSYNSMFEEFSQKDCRAGEDARALLGLARNCGVQIDKLQAMVDGKLSRMNLGKSSRITWNQVQAMISAGIVSHAILRPYSQLPEVASSILHSATAIQP